MKLFMMFSTVVILYAVLILTVIIKKYILHFYSLKNFIRLMNCTLSPKGYIFNTL